MTHTPPFAGSDSIPTTLFYASASSTQSQIFQAETHRILIEHKKYKKHKKYCICNKTSLGHFYKNPQALITLLDI